MEIAGTGSLRQGRAEGHARGLRLRHSILGAFVKKRKAFITSSCLSVCLYVCPLVRLSIPAHGTTRLQLDGF
jgi:hypothetical protein